VPLATINTWPGGAISISGSHLIDDVLVVLFTPFTRRIVGLSRKRCTGGKTRLLGISKRGDPYLRKLFVHGARAVITRVKRDEHSFGEWLNRIEARSPKNVAIVAMANKLARIAWAVLPVMKCIRRRSVRKEKMEITL